MSSSQTAPLQSWRFYVEGVHCASCVTQLEDLPRQVQGVQHSLLQYGPRLLSIDALPSTPLSDVVHGIEKLGYRPKFLGLETNLQVLEKEKKREKRLQMLRIAVAGFGAGNIMILAAGVYTGALAHYARFFDAVAAWIALPVIFFSGAPILRSIPLFLKHRTIHIDLTLALAISASFVISVLSIVRGHGPVYFDSATALIFLILSARQILNYLNEKAISQVDLHQILVPGLAHLVTEDGTDLLAQTATLQGGQNIRVYPGEIFPVDGKVKSGNSHVQMAILTGEPHAISIGPQSVVFAGSRNETAPITLEIAQTEEGSRLSKILKKAQEAREKRTHYAERSDSVARYYVLAMSAAALAVGLFFGVERALSVLLVTCPCALALAIPLSSAQILARAAKKGICIRSPEVLERLLEIQHVVFDKTGTLTEGKFEWIGPKPPRSLASVIYALESHSLHPIGRSILAALEPLADHLGKKVEKFREIRGTGIEGWIDGNFYQIQKSDLAGHLDVLENHKRIFQIQLRDQMKAGVSQVLRELREEGLTLSILSGDHPRAVAELAEQFAVPFEQIRGGLSSEEKARLISPFTLMTGDGVNDAIALEKAHVGVSLRSGLLDASPAADVVVSHSDVTLLPRLFHWAKEARRSYRIQLAVTVLYNLSAGTTAALGHVTPLIAALIMPLSSVSALLLSQVLEGKEEET
jgi:Cu2+-exporting ATPase/Cu+-exporting ATPase